MITKYQILSKLWVFSIALILLSCDSHKKAERDRLIKEKQEIEEGLRIFEEENDLNGINEYYDHSTDTWNYSKTDKYGNTIGWTEAGYISPTERKSIAYQVAEQSAKDRIKP